MSVECTGKVWNWRSHRAGSCRPCGPGWCQRAWEQKAMLLFYFCIPKGSLTFHCSTARRLWFPEQSQGNPTATTAPGLGPWSLLDAKLAGCWANVTTAKCKLAELNVTAWEKHFKHCFLLKQSLAGLFFALRRRVWHLCLTKADGQGAASLSGWHAYPSGLFQNTWEKWLERSVTHPA